MELIIDIGNSYTKVALINHERVIRYFPFKSNEKINLSKLNNLKFDTVLISSVVNKLTPVVIKEIKKISKAKIIDIAKLKKKIKIGVNCTADEIGSDLYADLTATKKKFKGPVLIFDIGTVNKVLALDKNDVFIGASFFSGFEGSVRSMFHDTDKLPEIKLEYSNNFMGKTTISCINNGVLYSLVYSIEGFIKNYQKLLGKDMKVIVTGGGASLIRPILKNITYYPYLTILGIYYIYLENK
ncbi:MAG: type III pantothenate kinase [Bacilli bacterium]|nr:type III pantothenate kinase [Bacilli bacterium]